MINLRDFLIGCILLTALLTVSAARADTSTVTFTPPTEREGKDANGNPIPLAPEEIAGYIVVDNIGGHVPELCPTGSDLCLPSDATSFVMTTTNVVQTLYVIVVDTDGRESTYSPAVTIPASITNPKTVTGIQVSTTP